MNYFAIGSGILAVLLVLTLFTTLLLHHQTDDIAHLLERAMQEPDRAQAVALATQAKNNWENRYGLIATFIDHNELDEISTGFAEMDSWARLDDEDEFYCVCNRLADLIRHIYQAELPAYYNIL